MAIDDAEWFEIGVEPVIGQHGMSFHSPDPPVTRAERERRGLEADSPAECWSSPRLHFVGLRYENSADSVQIPLMLVGVSRHQEHLNRSGWLSGTTVHPYSPELLKQPLRLAPRRIGNEQTRFSPPAAFHFTVPRD